MDMETAKSKERILRLRQTLERTGLSRSTLYEKISAGTFPAPVNLGVRSVGWLESEVDEWIAACVKNRRQS